MAVYSTIEERELKTFLKEYDVGNLTKYDGILEGIENTNYKISTSKKNYILTIFEKRVSAKDLPFFINLKNHLVKKKFSCPKPISNKKNITLSILKNKPCLLVSFLEGSKVKNVTNNHCEQVGEILCKLHIESGDFGEKRVNGMGLKEWENIFNKCSNLNNTNYNEFLRKIEKELIFLKANWPQKLPKGIIHADVFQDNVFFNNNKFSGLIDFYFSCNDFLSYDIALTINAWCFNNNGTINKEKFRSLIKGYENLRILEEREKKNLSILLRGSALRILLTRFHDSIFHAEGAYVKPKNPKEFENILNFHQNNNIIKYL